MSVVLNLRPEVGLNLAALVESLGVSSPSLSRHIEGMPGLRRGIMLRVKEKLTRMLGQAAMAKTCPSRLRLLTSFSTSWPAMALVKTTPWMPPVFFGPHFMGLWTLKPAAPLSSLSTWNAALQG